MDFFEDDRYVVRFIRRELPDGCTYLVPMRSRHRPACAALLKGKVFEPRTHKLVALAQDLKPGNIVHAGTFYGDMLPSFSRIAGDHRVFAFEPLLENYVLARGVVDANQLGNVVLVSAALGEEVGWCAMSNTMRANPDRHAGGASRLDEAGTSSAAMLRLDGLGIKDVSVVHLDVEGSELQALHGAHDTLQDSRPILLIEDNLDNCTPFLEQLAYQKVGMTPAVNAWCPREAENLVQGLRGSGLLRDKIKRPQRAGTR